MPKRPASSSVDKDTPKRARKVMSLEEKVKVLDKLKEGKKKAQVARELGTGYHYHYH